MYPILRRLGGFLVLISSFVLAACGGSGGGGGGGPPPPPPPPAAIGVTQVFANVNLLAPTGMYQAPGDNTRWFAIERTGQIWVFDNDPNVASQSLFLNIAVNASGEGGLLGLAFHPDFGNGNFDAFVSYTRSGSPLESVISRFSSNDGGLTLDPTTETIIMTIDQDFANHNGGQIGFGQDGFLYAGWGDGGDAGDPLDRGQTNTNLQGSFTRVDVDGGTPYAIPPMNPFAGNGLCTGGNTSTGMNCPEIFAWGVRNPWRWSFDTADGRLWAGDVGQDAWEEVSVIELSMNYGWDDREGAHCFEPTVGCDTNNVDPITEYDHGQGQSITGGYVYHGTAVPSLANDYIFGDYITGRIFYVPSNSPIGTAPTELMDTSYNISSFAQDMNGEVYVIDFTAGNVYQIEQQ